MQESELEVRTALSGTRNVDTPGHLDLVHGDEYFLDDLLQLRHELPDPLLAVDHDDCNWQVLAEAEDPAGLDVRALTVAFDAAEDACVSEALRATSIKSVCPLSKIGLISWTP